MTTEQLRQDLDKLANVLDFLHRVFTASATKDYLIWALKEAATEGPMVSEFLRSDTVEAITAKLRDTEHREVLLRAVAWWLNRNLGDPMPYFEGVL